MTRNRLPASVSLIQTARQPNNVNEYLRYLLLTFRLFERGVPSGIANPSHRMAQMRNTSIAIGCLCAAFASGCSEPLPPSPPAAPLFVLPPVGAATDTALRIGDPLPEIETVDLNGNPVMLNAELTGGGHTLIIFWSTWCGFCMLELPHEVELARQYESRGLRVIGVNADDTPELAQAAVAEHGVPWLNVYEGPDLTISNELGIEMWPALLLFGPDGKLIDGSQHLRSIAVEVRPDGSAHQVTCLDWTLEQLLGSGAPSQVGDGGNPAGKNEEERRSLRAP